MIPICKICLFLKLIFQDLLMSRTHRILFLTTACNGMKQVLRTFELGDAKNKFVNVNY